MYALTSGLYSGKLSFIREYVQNAYDPPANASKVEISLENDINLIIKDNGNGMSKKELEGALGVGLYTKNYPQTEGLFGIGIWSGVPACDKIVILTKKQGTQQALRVEINAKGIMDEARKNVNIIEFMTKNTSEIETIEDPYPSLKSFTIIRLESLTRRIKKTLKLGEKSEDSYMVIKNYVSKTLPVKVSSNFQYKKEIDVKFDNLYIHPFEVLVNNENVTRYDTIKDVLREPVIKEFIINNKIVARGWACVNRRGKALDPQNRGIIFKHNGFTIGGWDAIRREKTGTFTERWIGEIFLISNEFAPTAGRDDIQPTDWSEEFEAQIKEFLIDLQSINSYITTNLDSPKKRLAKIDVKNKSKEENTNIVKLIENKNFKGDLSRLEEKPEFANLLTELKTEELNLKKEFYSKKDEVSTLTSEDMGRWDYKALINRLTSTEALKNDLTTLMQEKHEDKMTINPFKNLKEKITVKTGKIYSTFTEACDAIGSDLTIFKGAHDQKNSDKKVQEFFKDAHVLFRNYFEHAEDTPQTAWFVEAKDKLKLKFEISVLIILIENMIDEMQKCDETPQ